MNSIFPITVKELAYTEFACIAKGWAIAYTFSSNTVKFIWRDARGDLLELLPTQGCPVAVPPDMAARVASNLRRGRMSGFTPLGLFKYDD